MEVFLSRASDIRIFGKSFFCRQLDKRKRILWLIHEVQHDGCRFVIQPLLF